MESHHTGEHRSCLSQATTEHTADTARCGTMWRPWNEIPVTSVSAQHIYNSRLQLPNLKQELVNDKEKLSAFQHPVKLFWPKSKCYDFLYREAEELLRNFPVQATISLYQESDSSSDSEDEDTIEN
ncbi:protein ripply2 [Mixophyes fleayi]|uniref:protein ripply2 n=1 Tax=Mixophyes fleayi TaxID=3061075 RepID=UPI003F4E0D78